MIEEPTATAPALEQKIEAIKKEVDALQIALTGQSRPWFKNVSTLIAVAALLLSFVTTCYSHQRTARQDVQHMRQELRDILQRLAALPKENVEMSKKYEKDPGALSLISSFINQENSLLARHAAELVRRLPTEAVSDAEYQAVAVALQNAYDLTEAAEFLDRALESTQDFNMEVSVLRGKGNLLFLLGNSSAGRATYQEAADIFSKYPGYDPYTILSTGIWTELAWAVSEANYGEIKEAHHHLDRAEKILISIPPSPGHDFLSAQIAQTKGQILRAGVESLPLPAPSILSPP